MLQINRQSERAARTSRVSLRWHLVLLFLGAAALITFASGPVYTAKERALLTERNFERNEYLFRELSLVTLQALRDERPSLLQATIGLASRLDVDVTRIAIEDNEGVLLASWHAAHMLNVGTIVPFVKEVMIGDESVGRITIVRDVADGLARIEMAGTRLQWAVGIAMFLFSVITLASIEVSVVRPVIALRQNLATILRDPTVDPVHRAGLISREMKHLEDAAGLLRKAMLKGQEGERRLRIATDQAVMASRTKSEFLANMSHELRTPLNSIIGFSEMIMHERLGELGNSKYAEYAQDIHGSGSHLLQIINDILDLSKVEAGKLELREEHVDVDHMTNACLSIVRERAQEKDIVVETRIDPGLPPLLVDELRVRQALINLVGNAIKFTPAGGSVVVEAAQSEAHQPYLRVIDNGIGIAPEDIEKAMEPFGQADGALNRRYEGSGLGLPLTKALIELHDGHFEIDSDEGAGTTVTLTFPQERSQSPAPQAGSAPVTLVAAE